MVINTMVCFSMCGIVNQKKICHRKELGRRNSEEQEQGLGKNRDQKKKELLRPVPLDGWHCLVWLPTEGLDRENSL